MFFPFKQSSDYINSFVVLFKFDNCQLTETNVYEFDLFFACTQIDVGWLINFGISWEANEQKTEIAFE